MSCRIVFFIADSKFTTGVLQTQHFFSSLLLQSIIPNIIRSSSALPNGRYAFVLHSLLQSHGFMGVFQTLSCLHVTSAGPDPQLYGVGYSRVDGAGGCPEEYDEVRQQRGGLA